MNVSHGDADFSAVGQLLADRSRCRMLRALTGGRCLPATMLAAEAGVAKSTASSHLGKLVDAGLVTRTTTGRHQYYALAGPDVAHLLEQLARLAPAEEIRSLRDGTRAYALRRARTCYDHLGGRLGVALTEAMRVHGWLTGLADELEPRPPARAGAVDGVTGALTRLGRDRLVALGVTVPPGDAVRCCIDWTEQRPHLAGSHGRTLLECMLRAGWIRRVGSTRAVQVTGIGRERLVSLFPSLATELASS